MKFVRWFSLILLVLWVIFILVQIVEQFGDSGNYHGTVVDADTGEPIEGASVTVVWDRSVYITIESAAYFHNARETLTGKDGSFSVDAFPGINWSPFGYIR